VADIRHLVAFSYHLLYYVTSSELR
jgi:hypothetical protein